MATFTDAFSGRSACTLTLNATESTPTAAQKAANQSVVNFNLTVTGNGSSFNNSAGSWSLTVNGTSYTGSWTYNFASNNTVTLKGTTAMTVTHTTNGSKTIAVSATATDGGGTPLGTATIGSSNVVLTDFERLPTNPGAATFTRSGSVITATTAGSTFYGTGGKYEWQSHIDGDNYSALPDNATTLTTTTFDCGSTTATCYVKIRAYDSEGYSNNIISSIVGVPHAPATITAERFTRDVVVTSGVATGTGVSDYWVQYSTNGGSTWSTPQATTAYQYTCTNLTVGQTYLFRVYADNAIGSSAYTVSAPVFIPSGGKRWNGSAWASTGTAKRWDGTAWVDITSAKRWSGSAWTDLS